MRNETLRIAQTLTLTALLAFAGIRVAAAQEQYPQLPLGGAVTIDKNTSCVDIVGSEGDMATFTLGADTILDMYYGTCTDNEAREQSAPLDEISGADGVRLSILMPASGPIALKTEIRGAEQDILTYESTERLTVNATQLELPVDFDRNSPITEGAVTNNGEIDAVGRLTHTLYKDGKIVQTTTEEITVQPGKKMITGTLPDVALPFTHTVSFDPKQTAETPWDPPAETAEGAIVADLYPFKLFIPTLFGGENENVPSESLDGAFVYGGALGTHLIGAIRDTGEVNTDLLNKIIGEENVGYVVSGFETKCDSPILPLKPDTCITEPGNENIQATITSYVKSWYEKWSQEHRDEIPQFLFYAISHGQYSTGDLYTLYGSTTIPMKELVQAVVKGCPNCEVVTMFGQCYGGFGIDDLAQFGEDINTFTAAGEKPSYVRDRLVQLEGGEMNVGIEPSLFDMMSTSGSLLDQFTAFQKSPDGLNQESFIDTNGNGMPNEHEDFSPDSIAGKTYLSR